MTPLVSFAERRLIYMQVKVKDCFKYRMVAGEHYLFPLARAEEKWNAPLQLTETAAWIWTSLAEGKTQEEINAGMIEEFEVGPDTAESAVRQFCRMLLQEGLLTESV